jgi:hypothetical protein
VKYENPEDIPRDTETGCPIMGGQSLIATATITECDTGNIVTHTLVLPNLIIMMEAFGDGWQVGEHMMCTPAYVRIFLDKVLPEKVAKFDECECDFHQAHDITVEVLDP